MSLSNFSLQHILSKTGMNYRKNSMTNMEYFNENYRRSIMCRPRTKTLIRENSLDIISRRPSYIKSL
ncbi:hypothetical protein MXB_5721 [Myxobolus squamalis]|nr:hypothetical protein MXB_5721 [Myxobolus squamalis]